MTLTAAEVDATGAWLASVQLPTGMIPWWPGGHADPWNHVEAAMALDVAGRPAEAAAALRWLRDVQLPDGSWCLYYLAEGIEDPRRDPNVCAYLATGVLWHYLMTGDAELADELWSTIERALAWVLELQQPGGEILWSRDADGRAGRFALVTSTSSIQHSLRCAAAMGVILDRPRPAWLEAADAAAVAVRERPEAFEPKTRWAMDWYYPVLCGALTAEEGRRRIEAGWETFVYEGVGVRCVSDHDWITAAETSECVIALDRIGLHAHARQLLTWTRHLRDDNGAYWTGCAHPECVRYPGGERSTYSAAAVLMADLAVGAKGGAAELFRVDPMDLIQRPSRAAAALRPDPMQAGTPAPR